jgi:caffeoyl-CoA O-methyltransferase
MIKALFNLQKGALIQGLIKEHSPKLIVEVGTFMGYSAITMAQAALPTAQIVTFEKDFKWMLVAKRFTWQAKMSDRIEVRWGDATTQLQKLREPIDFLLLDAKPSEYLDYLKAAEQLLSPGSIIVADNAGNVCEIS